jgi:copper oxidase (laccase) domain-containing protein
VQGARCKGYELQARIAAVVPAAVFSSCLPTTHKHKVQGAKHESLAFHKRKPKLDEMVNSSQSNLNLAEKWQRNNLCTILSHYEYYSMRSRDSTTQNRQEAVHIQQLTS